MSEKLLHLGCGELVGPSWVNTDSSLNVLLDNYPLLKFLLFPFLPASSRQVKFRGARYLDLRKSWKFESASFDAVYSSHVFEHLSLTDGEHVLRECFRCLKPGGRIRFLMPSVDKDVEEYLRRRAASDPTAARDLFSSLNVSTEAPRGSWWYRLYFRFYDKNAHRMFYDAPSLMGAFAAAGFTEVVERGHGQSDIPHLAEVERADRFLKSVCVEGRKPQAAASRVA